MKELALRQAANDLADMSVGELTATARALDTYQEKIESMSGICATMRGLVFSVAKERLGHGKFLPWLSANFSKTRKTAAEDMRLAREFVKCNPTLHFRELADSLAKKAKEPELDLNNPLVAQVAEWVSGRPRVQLLLDFPGERGGKRSASKKLTSAEEHEQFLATCKDDFESAFLSLDQLIGGGAWKVTSITDGQREAAADLCREFAGQIKTFHRERR